MGGPSLAAVLFTDLVGSTAQRSELGEEVGEELRRTHDRLLAEAVEAHEGRVVKSTGDGIMATFPGAAEAVAGGVAIQQAVERHNRRADAIAALTVRTGLSAGDVTWEDGDAFGTPAIEAARLCARAEGGQILAADVVRLLAGAREGDRFVSAGELDLKGLPKPVTTWEIAWQPETAPVIPVPGGMAPVGGFSFVGRQSELQLLDEAWRAVVDGQRRVVFVSGEPGIGKTRLVSEFSHRAAHQGGVVLYGRAESELGLPYKPIVEALTGYVRDCPPTELAAQMGSLSGELARMVPQLTERVPDLDEPLRAEPETQRYRLFEAVVELLADASRSWPLVLVLDDLQWAGKPTILLLGHLVASDQPMRVLLVGGYRDTEVGPDHPLAGLLAEIHRVGGIQTFSLEGFSEAEVSDLTRGAIGSDPDGLAQQVVGATDGNPFFVTEILRAVPTTSTTGEVDLVSLGVPAGAQAMVAARLNQLHPDRRTVLETAAVIGQRFDLPLLCAVVDDDDLALAALSDAEAAGLVGTEELLGGRQFAHALIRDALYHSLTPTARIARHRHVVTALEALPDADRRLGELAHHATQAIDLLGIDTAIDYTRQAGDHAQDELAFEEAATHYQTAIDVLDRADRTATGLFCDLQITRAESLTRAGDPAAGDRAALDAAATARRLVDPTRLARAALSTCLGSLRAVDPTVADPLFPVVEEALDRIGPDDSISRARLLALRSLCSSVRADSFGNSTAAGVEAVKMARRLGDEATLVRVLSDTYQPLQTADNLQERVSVWGDELIETSYRIGDLEVANRALMYRATCHMQTGQLDLAEADVDEAERLLEALRQPHLTYYVLFGRASLALLKGDLDEAERLISEVMSHRDRLPQGFAQATADMLLLELFWHRGRLAEISEAALAILEAASDYPPYRATQALILAETGVTEEARRILDEFFADDFAGLVPDSLWLNLTTGLSLVAADTSHRPAAKVLELRLAPYADRIATNGMYCVGPVARALGCLAAVQGTFDVANHYFERAAALCEGNGLASWLAMTRMDWAQMLAAAREPGCGQRARHLAELALDAATTLGLKGVARDARQLLTGLET